MTTQLSEYERALRNLPLTYSLALRLREACVAPEVVCEYIGVDEAALVGVYRLAEEKLIATQQFTREQCVGPGGGSKAGGDGIAQHAQK